jgi:hypothetical protein
VYIKRYGFPKNGAFNAEQLAEIINELNLSMQPEVCATPTPHH